MLDVQKVNDTKQRILSMITTAGPSFPAKISRETNISPLFVGALLSELVAEQKLVMSSMKVGSSPLYLVKGQEQNLEKFTQYLNSKEQEVVFRLKQIQLLDDSAEDPATRVALRKIKDFAIPVSAKVDGEEKLFWKYFTLGESEANSILQKADKPKKAQKEDKAEEVEEKNKATDIPWFRLKIGDGHYKKEAFLLENRRKRHMGELPHQIVSIYTVCNKCRDDGLAYPKGWLELDIKFTDGVVVNFSQKGE